MRIYPAAHYAMGGLWVDYNLMSTVPGLFVLGEANFSDHGANRLGASALMQGLADGYFIIPYTIGNYFARAGAQNISSDRKEFKEAEGQVAERIKKMFAINGKRSVESFHKELGQIMWEYCGMARNEAGLKTALEKIPALREEFWKDARIIGDTEGMNVTIERAGRVADFLEFAEILCYDALDRKESCGAHFRTEYQTEEGEALRNDKDFAYVSAWEFKGVGNKPELHKEQLEFESVELATRSYK
jgi:succinate dehydrogenase / fumarate reductase flavoprotein subunit